MAGGRSSAQSLTVAVTGPTGEIGMSLVAALQRSRQVKSIRGMARREFDPAEHRWSKVSYQRGDVLDRHAVDALVDGADVVIHLAFIIIGGAAESRRVNLKGSKAVFEAAVAAGAKRLVYASSVAAYGFHADSAQPLTEEVPTDGSSSLYYSAQKAEVEQLLATTLANSRTQPYVFRPCIVAGPQAPALLDNLPYIQLSQRLPRRLRAALGEIPLVKPVLPDPGVAFQLVHHDDVATAMRAGALGAGEPGAYNLAGPGQITVATLARELGWRSVRIPGATVTAGSELVARLPFLPAQLQWISALREPVIMDTTKAKEELGWRPRHNAVQTLRETITAERAQA
ncbi:MAG TPA: NAD-dependent epimerase/dehydratase family protein [Solirubrobacteraceae bacterium]|jgi:nucleoside-diphosphate-sugar epimerase|nr:NAD-dependent epimerase/dehydratase family protein [Solirubrobacteraceae bacterium]